MAMPEFTMRELLESGVHYGHHTRRWNPKMRPHIFGVRNGVHIIDLQQTVPMLDSALVALRNVAARGGRILFVGTKRQASDKVKEAAKRCGQYYVNHRWLGGMLTNWKTISNSIARFRELEKILEGDVTRWTKKEVLMMTREYDKLEASIGGIRDMGGQPDIAFVIDTNKEELAIAECNKLGIPIVGVLDTNSNPDGIDFPVPGNDDAIRAIDLYLSLASSAVLDGISAEMAASGVDTGAAEEVKVELPAEDVVAAEAKTEAKADAKAEVTDKKKAASA